jgi:CcmD family protein
MNPELLVGGVTLLIWIGVFLYLVRLDKKIRDLQR